MPKPAAKRRADPTPVVPPPVNLYGPRPVDRPAVIDEYGRICSKLASMSALLRRQEQLRSMILSWYQSHDLASPIDEDGEQYSVHISPAAMERRIINMKGVAERIGLERFIGMCSLSLAKLDTCVPLRDQVESGLVIKERAGPRTMKPIQKFVTA